MGTQLKSIPKGSAYYAGSYTVRTQGPLVSKGPLNRFTVLYEIQERDEDTSELCEPMAYTKKEFLRLRKHSQELRGLNSFQRLVRVPLTDSGKRKGKLRLSQASKAALWRLKPWEYLSASSDGRSLPETRAVLKTVECSILAMRELRRTIVENLRDGIPCRKAQRAIRGFVARKSGKKGPKGLRCRLEVRYGTWCLSEITDAKHQLSSMRLKTADLRFACLADGQRCGRTLRDLSRKILSTAISVRPRLQRFSALMDDTGNGLLPVSSGNG